MAVSRICMAEKSSENQKRESIFTVRDAESAVVTYTILLFIYIVGICVYKWITGWNGTLAVLVALDTNYQRFNKGAVAWIICKEGVDIMLRRYNEWRVEHAQNLEKARAEGITEGVEKGIAEGVEKGKAELYQEIVSWNARRLEAEAKNIPFNEPIPGNGTPPPSKDD